MKSAVSLLFILFSASAAFSLRFIPVSTKRFVTSAKSIPPITVTSDHGSEPPIVLKTKDYLSSLPSNVIPSETGTPLCNLYLDLINDPERYLASIQRDVRHGIRKGNMWSLVVRYIGFVVRRLRLGSSKKSTAMTSKISA